MSDRFELSFKNKVVRIWLFIFVPSVMLEIFLELFTEFPRIIPAVVPAISLIIFFVWFYFHKRKQNNGHSDD